MATLEQAAWLCPACGERLEDAFDACWKCGADRAGAPADLPPFEPEPSPGLFAFTAPCPICGLADFSWGVLEDHSLLAYRSAEAPQSWRLTLTGRRPLTARLCETCGNVQAFVSDLLEPPPPEVS